MDKHEYDEQMKQLCKGNGGLVLANFQAQRIHKLERKIAEMETAR